MNQFITKKGDKKMGKDDMQAINEVMKKFDPVLVAVAIGGIGVKSGPVAEEVGNIKTALSQFDSKTVTKVAADYINTSSMTFHCGGPVCICPENDGCGKYAIRTDVDRSIRELGMSMVTAARDLDKNLSASAVMGASNKFGYAALCWDSVRCTGSAIYVMSECFSSLYAFDIGKNSINPVDAIQAIAKSKPALLKRVNKMLEEMKKAGELPG
jgi:hypothetical protein